ncbi:MAG: NAD(P)H-hydrate dehydratase [Leptolyngbyaceae cyanobacterium SL_7_1]|nr:NAD(P)H-hydrate dehydratase [Leptolyngbyaceae cyanobacterium SL_7_1]
MRNSVSQCHSVVVTAEQMGAIEARLFAAGMPVAALMEKVAGLVARRLQTLYPREQFPRVGVLVGPGHNGGDALVIARELHANSYEVIRYQPFDKLKELTATHAQYADHLGISCASQVDDLSECDLIVDGLFGIGLTRSLEGSIAAVVDRLNQFPQPVVSLDLPSGLHTDTGAVLGTAIRATHTVCLGLWKRAFMQDDALAFIGTAELIDFDVPAADVAAVVGTPAVQLITPETAIAALPLPRPPATHKYKQGHLLLICGSRQYGGAAVLSALAARASGVGMLSIAIPESLRVPMTLQVPDAVLVSCPETETGAIAHLPQDIDLSKYHAIACGPGLTPHAKSAVQQGLGSDRPLLLDADGLNILSTLGAIETLKPRPATTVLTPHWGEFKRLFPQTQEGGDRLELARLAAQDSGAIVLLKGARTAIATQDCVWVNPASTPALARGGSGDVLTGLMGGLMAQAIAHETPVEAAVRSAAWWHAQAGILATQERTELGVDASTVVRYLVPSLRSAISN